PLHGPAPRPLPQGERPDGLPHFHLAGSEVRLPAGTGGGRAGIAARRRRGPAAARRHPAVPGGNAWGRFVTFPAGVGGRGVTQARRASEGGQGASCPPSLARRACMKPRAARCCGEAPGSLVRGLEGRSGVLVLSRKKNESLVINNDITITVIEIR